MKIGIISDIHEDITRLNEAFELLDKEQCDEIVCLGDIVGYSVPYYRFLWSRDAHAVIESIKAKCSLIMAGNHDLFAIKKLPKFRTGYKYPKNWYSLDFKDRKRLSENKIYLYEDNELSALLTYDDKSFIQQLPEYYVKPYDSVKVLFSHYAYPDLVGNTKFEPETSEDAKKHFAFMNKRECTLGISAHDHIEGLLIFTEDEVRKVSFNETVKIADEPTWLHGPGVVNGTFANGVMVFDSGTMEITALPLNSEKHVPPE